ncbi:hypothetical protein L6452_13249 [Arctium lappa]|uniref:Uncharacterized protein n=1 Tax=Arctium lappa TaxID=4217 RepID=A0ACB9CHL0_ARCLA|nr:hypothetical protein L6452_13249 [Arctium lappa]
MTIKKNDLLVDNCWGYKSLSLIRHSSPSHYSKVNIYTASDGWFLAGSADGSSCISFLHLNLIGCLISAGFTSPRPQILVSY